MLTTSAQRLLVNFLNFNIRRAIFYRILFFFNNSILFKNNRCKKFMCYIMFTLEFCKFGIFKLFSMITSNFTNSGIFFFNLTHKFFKHIKCIRFFSNKINLCVFREIVYANKSIHFSNNTFHLH